MAQATEVWAPHWTARVSTIGHHASAAGTNGVLLYGDSNTEGFWWNKTAGCSIINAGMGGARIKQLAENAAYVATTTRPAIVHIMIGTNNIEMDTSSAEWAAMPADLHTIVQAFKAVNAVVVLWPVPPVNAALSASMPNSSRLAINAVIQSEAWASSTFWDWWVTLQYEDSSGYAIAGANLPDGVHFSASTQLARRNRLDVWSRYISANAFVTCSGLS